MYIQNFSRKWTILPRQLLQLQMFWYIHVYFLYAQWNSTKKLGPTLRPKILWQSSDFICTQLRHPALMPKWVRQNIPQTSQNLFDCRYCVLFSLGIIQFSVNSRLMSFSKKLFLDLICPHDILPEGFQLLQLQYIWVNSSLAFFYVSVSAVGSSWLSCNSIAFHSDVDGQFELTLLHPESTEQLEFVLKMTGAVIHHLDYPSLLSF